jgi:hypothetical protein
MGLSGGISELISLQGFGYNHGTAPGRGVFGGSRRRFGEVFAGNPVGFLAESRFFLNQHAAGYGGVCWLNAGVGNTGDVDAEKSAAGG